MKLYTPNCEIKNGMTVPQGVHRVALQVEYSGTHFHGFQRQAGTSATVQACLERAISFVANAETTVVCAGRTDAGVHATAQVIHFDTQATRPLKAWLEGVNTRLPGGVRVVAACEVPLDFHARFSARARTYHYIIVSSPVKPAIMGDCVTWTAKPLDVDAMHLAGQALLGVHDFSSFRSSQCQAHSPVREIQQIAFRNDDRFIVMRISANAFLHHMVRNIVGALLEVGQGRKPTSWLSDVLQLRDRSRAPATAAAHGLYLTGVRYGEAIEPFQASRLPLFLSQKELVEQLVVRD